MPPNQLEQVLQNHQAQLQSISQQLLRTRQLATAQQAESRLRSQGTQPRMPIEFTSQFGEDLAA